MKFKTFFLMLILSCSFLAFGMEVPEQNEENQIQHSLSNLPNELGLHIMLMLVEQSDSIENFSKNLRALICACSSLEKLLNNPFCLQYLLNSLSEKFDIVNKRYIASFLKTSEAKAWLKKLRHADVLDLKAVQRNNKFVDLAINQMNCLDSICSLLKDNANIDTLSFSRKTLLMYAASLGNVNIVRFLTRNGANIFVKGSFGDALGLATQASFLEKRGEKQQYLEIINLLTDLAAKEEKSRE